MSLEVLGGLSLAAANNAIHLLSGSRCFMVFDRKLVSNSPDREFMGSVGAIA